MKYKYSLTYSLDNIWSLVLGDAMATEEEKWRHEAHCEELH